MRGDQLGRQWRIIQTLVSSRYGKSAADLAGELDCHPRTVYRDLEALQVAGFPMYTERVEGKNLWSLLDTVKHHMPIPFSLTELMALYFSRDMLKIFKHTAFYDSLETLFQKIRTTLPPESINYLKAVEQTLTVGLKPFKDYAQFREIINQVSDAAIKKRSIEIVYFTMSRKKETKRKVDPYRIWFFKGTFYLIGHCHLRDEIRIFALDRIKMLHQTKDSFTVPEDFDLEEFVRPSFGVFQGAPVRVKVWFAPDIAGYITEKVWHETQKIQELDDGSVIFEAEVAGLDEIKFWIMSWGANALVLKPKSLRDNIRSEAIVMLENYSTASEDAGKLVRESD
jgi:predicted DNA-binding transcriptional regulator YafY